MEQKLIEAKFKKNRFAQVLFIVGAYLVVLSFWYLGDLYKEGYFSYDYGHIKTYYNTVFDNYGDFLIDFLFNPFQYDFYAFLGFCFYTGVLSILFASFFWWKMSKCELTVTDRRVVGKTSFGKAVDLPLNQISAVALGIFSKITVATSSGKVYFWFIQNRLEVHSVLTNVIGKVQVESAYSKNNISAISSNADELKKFKELLDSGIITQDEFEQKKKHLLNL